VFSPYVKIIYSVSLCSNARGTCFMTESSVKKRRLSYKSVALVLCVVAVTALTAWGLVTVSTASIYPQGLQPTSAFVTLPNSTLSKNGTAVRFTSVSAVASGDVMAVRGYLLTSSGSPIAGANVYFTYFVYGAYKTQMGLTDQNGFFQVPFPINWTGWLPLTLTYFGDSKDNGLTQHFELFGETT